MVIDGQALQVCHQESPQNADGLFQKETEGLGLKLKDQWILSTHNEFISYQKKFNLPDFNGLSVRNWIQLHQETFPKGADLKEEGNFRSLVQFCQVHGVDFQAARQLSQKIKILDPLAPKKTSPGMEKVQALKVASLLLSVQKEESPFYLAKSSETKRENKAFVDSVVKWIEEGKLSLQNITQPGKEMWGVDKFLMYEPKTNSLQYSGEFNLEGFHDRSGLLHELYHFYQDGLKIKTNKQDLEAEAYRVQGEYNMRILEAPEYKKQYRNAGDYIQREFLDKGKAPEQPTYYGLIMAEHRLRGREKEAKKSYEGLRNAINTRYYVSGLLKEVYTVVQPELLEIYREVLREHKDSGSRLKAFEKHSQKFSEKKNQDLKALETFDWNTPGVREGKFASHEELTQYALATWLSWICIEFFKDWVKSGDTGNKEEIKVDVGDPRVNEMVKTVSRFRVLQHLPMEMDGV